MLFLLNEKAHFFFNVARAFSRNLDVGVEYIFLEVRVLFMYMVRSFIPDVHGDSFNKTWFSFVCTDGFHPLRAW